MAHSLALRASAEATGTPLDPGGITDPDVDPLVPGGKELVGLVDSTLAGTAEEVAEAAQRVEETMGGPALVDAAGVIANFEMMNRIADGTGVPVGKGTLARTAEWRRVAGIDRLFDGR